MKKNIIKFLIVLMVLTIGGDIFSPATANAQAAYCSSAGPDGETTYATTGTRRTYAYGVGGSLGHMYFPTWTESGGQDDIIWYPGINAGGGTWYVDINLASHTAVGNIFVHVYVYDSSNVPAFCDYANFSRINQPATAGTTWNIADGCVEAGEVELVTALPSTLITGQTYNFTIRYKNTGTTWWYHRGFSWDGTAFYQPLQKNTSYTLGLVSDDPGSVNNPPTAPAGAGGGAWGERTISIVAPSVGSHTLTMQMHHGAFPDYTYQLWDGTQCGNIGGGNDAYQWFGNTVSQSFTVDYPPCVGSASQSCTSSANSCGTTSTGTQTRTCSAGVWSGWGSCSVGVPANPSGYGNACSSTPNACGSTNPGTIQCNGTCSASAPANPSGYGNACSSTPNACGSTNPGTIQCNGTCSASTPSNPTGYGNVCTGATSSANACGMTSTGGAGTYQCNGSCSGATGTTPSNSLCPLSTVTVTVTPTSVQSPTEFSVTMSSTNASSCTWSRSGSYSGNWSGAALGGTSYSSGPLSWGQGNATWTFTCLNSAGTGATNSGSVTVTNASCSSPWGTVSHGYSNTAYQSSSVPYGSTCASETRTCSNGTMSGSYTATDCSVTAAASCSSPWGTVAHGYSNTAYSASSADVCQSQTRTCSNGTLSGSYPATSCTVNSYSITASAGAGGSISPTGATSKSYGTSQAYTITPSSGYYISDVLVNGSSVGAVGSYTFSNISSSQTISASFASAYPTLSNVTISSTNVNPNNSTQYNIVISGTNPTAIGGGANISHHYALINYQGGNAGSHRGYLTWYYDSDYTGWNGQKNKMVCSPGGGVAAIQSGYGAEYIRLISCSTVVSGITRTTTFTIVAETGFTTPATNNDISGYIHNTQNLYVGWNNFDLNFNMSVDGGWTAWSPTACPTACGLPASSQTRSCTNPSPGYGGATCSGVSSQTCAATPTCNTAPNAPTISGPSTGYPDTSYSYTFTATDAQTDTIRYGVDWNMDGTADEWLPAGVSYVSSGANRSTSYSWSTTGNKTFRALTQDYPGLNSSWTNYSVTISASPVNGFCGTANRTYPVGSTSYGGDTYCSAGSASASPAFPTPGNSASWICNGLNGGAPSGTCTATNPQAEHNIIIDATPKGSVNIEGGITCGAGSVDCPVTYEEGTTIYLRAYPISSFWKFSGWTGLCTDASYLCVLEVERPGTIIPNFVPRLFDYLEF